MPFFKSKHQRLILQCYPPGRDIDKKPNSSELSYLLYYASTRRVKLEKVGSFLESKTLADLHHLLRYGNVQVLLAIFLQLVEKCGENLNVFAENLVNVIYHTLQVGDLILSQLALKTFKIFCSSIDVNDFIGDPELNIKFHETVDLFFSRVNVSNQWKIIAIKSAKYLSNTLGIVQVNSLGGKNGSGELASGQLISSQATVVSKSAAGNLHSTTDNYLIVNSAIELILSVLKKNLSLSELNDKVGKFENRNTLNSTSVLGVGGLNVQPTKSNVSLKRTVSVRSGEVPVGLTKTLTGGAVNSGAVNGGAPGAVSVFDLKTEDALDLDTAWSDLDCAEDALVALQTYFKSSENFELSSALKAVNNFIYKLLDLDDPETRQWCTYLLQLIINYTPVLLRFLVLTILINKLVKVAELKEETTIDYQITLTHIISGLLNSNANMIGLSILDILKNLISLQLASVDFKNKELAIEIQANYTRCISSLSKHIYYHDQVSDILEEIFFKVNDSFSVNDNETKLKLLFQDINQIIDNGAGTTSKVDTEGVEVYGGDEIDVDLFNTLSKLNHVFQLLKPKVSVLSSAWLNFAVYINERQHVSLSLITLYYEILIKLSLVELGFHEANNKILPILVEMFHHEFSFNELFNKFFNAIQNLNLPFLKTEVPNYNSLIVGDGVDLMLELFKNYEKLLSLLESQVFKPEEQTNALYCMLVSQVLILQIFGINFAYNALESFIFNLDQTSSNLQKTFAYVMLQSISSYFVTKSLSQREISYYHLPESSSSSQSLPFVQLENFISNKVQNIVSQQKWDSKIPILQLKPVKINKTTSFPSKEDIFSFLKLCDTTDRWIVQAMSGSGISSSHGFGINESSRLASNSINSRGDSVRSVLHTHRTGQGESRAQNFMFENSSVLSISKLLVNMNNGASVVAGTTTGATNGGIQVTGATSNGAGQGRSRSGSSMLKVHELRTATSKPSFGSINNAVGTKDDTGPTEKEIVDDVQKMLKGLMFDSEQYKSKKVCVTFG